MTSLASETFHQMREQAKSFHQRGEFLQAEQAYKELLRMQESADVLGLLALCKFQMGKQVEAFALWRRALSMTAGSRVVWRNTNNALAAALSNPKKIDPPSFLPPPIPVWDDDTAPTAVDTNMVQSLVAALEMLGRVSEINGLLPSFIVQIDVTSAEAITLMRWVLDKKIGPDATRSILERLEKVTVLNSELLLLKGACHFAEGEISKSEAIADAVAMAEPLFLSPEMPSQQFVVGVLNRPPLAVTSPMSVSEFHFRENTPVSLVKQLSNDLRLFSFFPNEAASHVLARLEAKPDIILNNWATAEILATPGTLDEVNRALRVLDVPILNAPDDVVLTTRQRNAEALQGIKDVVVPRVLRFENWSGNQISVALMLESEIGFPLILREPFQQMGLGIHKVEAHDQLLSALGRLGAGQFYAIAYIDNPLAPSLYRKFRAAVIGQEVFITHVHFGSGWNVHRVRDAQQLERVTAAVGLIRDAKILLENPEAPGNRRVFGALQRIRERLPLDIFGIDFDVMPDGRVLFFEANAAMNLSFNESGGASLVRTRMRLALLELFRSVVRQSADRK